MEKFPGVNDTYDLGDNGLNAQPYTVMTYNDIDANEYMPEEEADNGFLEGLGAFDIAATQYLYGPNKNQSTGDDTYYLDEEDSNGWYCIWDNGGTDTITAEDATKSVSIDLRNATLENEVGGGGYISQIGNDSLGLTIAYNSTGDCIIENATGSDQDDTLIGNEVNNILDGGAGDDTMSGGDGNDTYIVDSKGDRVTEKSSGGNDTIKSSLELSLVRY